MRWIAPDSTHTLVDDEGQTVAEMEAAGFRLAPYAQQPPEIQRRMVRTAIPMKRPDFQKAGLDLIPGGMATLGGLIGVPGAAVSGPAAPIAGAMLGGGAGQLLRNVLAMAMGRNDLAPQNATSGAMNVLSGAVYGGLGEGAAQGVGAGAKWAGRALMKDALRPSASLAKESVARGGMKAAQVMERERIPVGVIGKGVTGYQRAGERLSQNLARRDAALSSTPGTVTVMDVVNEASPALAELRKRAATPRQLQSVNDFIAEAASMNAKRGPKGGTIPQKLSMMELNQRKTTWDAMAKGQYAAEARTGSKAQAAQGVAGYEQEVAKALADAARRILAKRVKDLPAINQTSSELGLLRRALLEAEARPTTINPFMHASTGNANFLLAHPEITSRLGLGLTHPAITPAARLLLQNGLPASQMFPAFLPPWGQASDSTSAH